MSSCTETHLTEGAQRTAASFLHRGKDFVLCRFPGEPFSLFAREGDRSAEVCFRIKPGGAGPAFDLFPLREISSEDETGATADLFFEKPPEAPTDFEAYASGFALLSKAFTRKIARKVVLSRVKHATLPENFDPLYFFERVAEAYPGALVSLTASRARGIWIGASPEVLLRTEGNTLITHSLAGTRAAASDVPWGQKEREEQELVSRHIRTVLMRKGAEDVSEDEPQTFGAGPVEHLLTTFRFSAKENTVALIDALHPTPAVSGLPVQAAEELIMRAEPHDRGLYTGYLGRLGKGPKTIAETALYVNLRCMHLGRETAAIYTGGGITAASVLRDEWEETEKKALTLTKLLDD